MQGTPLWMRGDSNRGLALWPVDDGFVLSVHLADATTDLHLAAADVEALREALNSRAAPPAPLVEQVRAGNGPPCDRCKQSTERTPDGYACRCGNVIVWT